MSDARQKFQTYLFFLRHFDRFVRHGRNDQSTEHLIAQLITEQQPLLAGIQAHTLTAARRDALRKMLFNAWNSRCDRTARLHANLRPRLAVWGAVDPARGTA